MGIAYKCDLTGEIKEGAGVKVFFMELGNLRLKIIPQRKIADKSYDQGDLSPESVKKIEAAVRSGLNLPAAAPAEKAKASK